MVWYWCVELNIHITICIYIYDEAIAARVVIMPVRAATPIDIVSLSTERSSPMYDAPSDVVISTPHDTNDWYADVSSGDLE